MVYVYNKTITLKHNPQQKFQPVKIHRLFAFIKHILWYNFAYEIA